jgi:hypothetical protein
MPVIDSLGQIVDDIVAHLAPGDLARIGLSLALGDIFQAQGHVVADLIDSNIVNFYDQPVFPA